MNSDRQQEILDEVTCLQYDPETNRKKMTFAQAWATLQKHRPELFDYEPPIGTDRPFAQKAPGIQQPMVTKAAEALARAQKRSRTIHASRPQNPEGEFTVQGGFAVDLFSGKVLVTQPDGSVVEAVSE
jgi:hypothetical protein